MGRKLTNGQTDRHHQTLLPRLSNDHFKYNEQVVAYPMFRPLPYHKFTGNMLQQHKKYATIIMILLNFEGFNLQRFSFFLLLFSVSYSEGGGVN